MQTTRSDSDHPSARAKTPGPDAVAVVSAPVKPRHRVVIVGAGFAGLYAAKALRNQDVDVLVLDRSNHHLFQPLLYQVATAVLNPSDIAVPIRHVLRAPNVQVLLAEVEGFDLEGRKVHCQHGDEPFDDLIVATGATHSYFGHGEWAGRAPGLKTIADALEIRRRILGAYEMAERETDPERRRAWLTFAVVGGGPTGVELAGALAEISRRTLPGEFRNIDPKDATVILLEGQNDVLTAYPERLRAHARKRLERLGVKVRTGALVTGMDDGNLFLGEERIAARTVLWSAGVVASPLATALDAPRDRAGRVKVTERLTLPGHDDVFVVGDLAAIEQDGSVVQAMAPAAIQAGRHVAKAILARRRGKPIRPFRYRDKGMFAVIGRGSAVGLVGKRFAMRGFFAWVAWLLIHVAMLIGFRNRVAVMLGWAYSFVTFRRQARLITGSEPPALEPTPGETKAG